MIKRHLLLPSVAATLLLAAGSAEAHTGIGGTSGFARGLAHPISGIDHVLTMVAVGLFAAHLAGRALWLVPLSFVSMMIVGGVLGMTGVHVPFVEFGIGLSIIALGTAIAFSLDIPTLAAMVMVGFFAVFHGHAHGAEMPETASGLEYGLGFILATAALHCLGIGLGIALGGPNRVHGPRILRLAGSAMALCGVAILAGSI